LYTKIDSCVNMLLRRTKADYLGECKFDGFAFDLQAYIFDCSIAPAESP
jgi:hypothetical protein